MTKVWTERVNFNKTAGTTVAANYGTTPCPGLAGLEIRGNGFDAIATSEDGDAFTASAAPDTRKEMPHPSEHYAQVKIISTAFTYSPGALVRCDPGSRNDYGIDPVAFFGGLEIFEHTGGGWVAIASGGATVPGVGDTIRIEAEGTALRAYVNEVLQCSTTDASLATGVCGIYCYNTGNVAIGDDYEAGHLYVHRVWDPLRNTPFNAAKNQEDRRRRERFTKITAGEN